MPLDCCCTSAQAALVCIGTSSWLPWVFKVNTTEILHSMLYRCLFMSGFGVAPSVSFHNSQNRTGLHAQTKITTDHVSGHHPIIRFYGRTGLHAQTKIMTDHVSGHHPIFRLYPQILQFRRAKTGTIVPWFAGIHVGHVQFMQGQGQASNPRVCLHICIATMSSCCSSPLAALVRIRPSSWPPWVLDVMTIKFLCCMLCSTERRT